MCTPDVSEVCRGLFLGNEKASSNRKRLDTLGVKTVINVTTALPNCHPSSYTYHRVAIEDKPTTDLVAVLSEVRWLRWGYEWTCIYLYRL